jgi:hypothetical protein
MDSNTKKALYYTGGAILVGAVGFFVYSFFKKDEFIVGNTTFSVDKDDKTTPKTTTGFIPPKTNFSEGINWTPTPLSELWNKIK